MLCPICHKESHGNICLECGYDLENYLLFKENRYYLSQKEIDKYNQQSEILKRNYNQLKHNNLLGNLDIDELESYGLEYYRKQDYLTSALFYNESMLRGSFTAALHMGVIYEYGRGVQMNYVKAKECYQIAADHFDSIALYKLGTFYERGLAVDVDYTKARRLYREAADLGETQAMIALGKMYEKGLGVDINYIKAKRWYNEAVDFEDGEAMVCLSKLYEAGKGCCKNIKKAMDYLEEAIECGYLLSFEDLMKLNAYKEALLKEED